LFIAATIFRLLIFCLALGLRHHLLMLLMMIVPLTLANYWTLGSSHGTNNSIDPNTDAASVGIENI
jgi:hypothetical protein